MKILMRLHILLFVVFWGSSLNAQSVILVTEIPQAEVGETVCIPVRVNNFENIVGVQFSINFDVDHLEFDSIRNLNLPGLSILENFGTPGAGVLNESQLTFLWTTPGLNPITVEDGTTIFEVCMTILQAPLCQGLLFSDIPTAIEVTDGNNEIVDVEFSYENSLYATFEVSDATCADESGQFTLSSVSGGSGSNYSYEILGNEASIILGSAMKLPIGDYELLISDGVCLDTLEVEIGGPDPLEVANLQVTNTSCGTFADGSIEVEISGGTEPYTYLWSVNGEGSNRLENLGVGLYDLIIVDVNGCTLTINDIQVTDSPILGISEDVVICAGESIELRVDAPTGLSFSWIPAESLDNPTIANPVVSPATTTTYNVLTMSTGGCIGEDSVTVFVLPETCTETLEDTIVIGQSANWCSLFSNLSGLGYTALNTCSPTSGIFSYNWDDQNFCLDYFGASLGTDTLCFEVCTPNGGQCFDLQIIITVEEDLVWPGDANLDGVANHFDLLNIGLAYDEMGPVRIDGSFDWFGQFADNWDNRTPESRINFKHADTDGNGLVNADDTLGIAQNWGETHLVLRPSQIIYGPDPTDGVPIYVEPDTLYPNLIYELPIVLGTEDIPARQVYGLAFSIKYDPDVIQMNSAKVVFSDSWLGTPDEETISIQRTFHEEGRIDVAITRTDKEGRSGNGEIGSLIVGIEDIIFLSSNQLQRKAVFEIIDVQIIDNNEGVIAANTTPFESNVISSTKENLPDLFVQVYPNPVRSYLMIDVQGIRLEQVELLNSAGQVKQIWEAPSRNRMELNPTELASGSYYLRITTDQGITLKRIMVIR